MKYRPTGGTSQKCRTSPVHSGNAVDGACVMCGKVTYEASVHPWPQEHVSSPALLGESRLNGAGQASSYSGSSPSSGDALEMNPSSGSGSAFTRIS